MGSRRSPLQRGDSVAECGEELRSFSTTGFVLRFGAYYAALAGASLLCAETVHAVIARGARDLLLLLPGAPRIAGIASDGPVFCVTSHHPALVLSVVAPSILIPLLVPTSAALARHDLPIRTRALLAGSLALLGILLLSFGAALNCLSLLADTGASQGINLYPESWLGLASAGRTVTWRVLDLLYPAICTLLVAGAPILSALRSPAITCVARRTPIAIPSRSRYWAWGAMLLVASVVAVDLSASRRLARYDCDLLLAQLEELSPEIGEYYLAQGTLLFSTQRLADALSALDRAARYPRSAERARRLIERIHDAADANRDTAR